MQMAGANLAPPSLGDSAVVVIDAQREYVDGKVILPAVGPALSALAALLDKARRAGAPVIHVAHRGNPNGLFDPAGPGYAFADQAKPAAGERAIDKRLPNAFAGTELEKLLRESQRTSLIFAGFMTHMCVSSTVRAALDLGFKSTVVSDACATRDLPDPLGGAPLTAAELQRAELAALADRFAVICRAADIGA
jgi:nicotinamidase-related amidase